MCSLDEPATANDCEVEVVVVNFIEFDASDELNPLSSRTVEPGRLRATR